MMRTNPIVFNCCEDFFEQFDLGPELNPIATKTPTKDEGGYELNYRERRSRKVLAEALQQTKTRQHRKCYLGI